MLQHLFERIGFAWGVRVSALISGVGCVIATLTVSNNRGTQRKNSKELQIKNSMPYIDTTAFKDPRFLLLTLGSCFVALGTYYSGGRNQEVGLIFKYRTLHSILLRSGVCRTSQYITTTRVLRAFDYECRKHFWPNSTSIPLRHHRTFQPPSSCCVSLWSFDIDYLVQCQQHGGLDGLCGYLWFRIWSVHIGAHARGCIHLGKGTSGNENGDAIQRHICSVSCSLLVLLYFS
jgi:hypothetical protein